jgi:hypothetical protein
VRLSPKGADRLLPLLIAWTIRNAFKQRRQNSSDVLSAYGRPFTPQDSLGTWNIRKCNIYIGFPAGTLECKLLLVSHFNVE